MLVLTNGGVLAIDELLISDTTHTLTDTTTPPGALTDTPIAISPGAIVEAFSPSVTGANALAALLFGLENKWGKMPVTMYPKNYTKVQPMTNYDMAKAPGRTYKYYDGDSYGAPLFAFGHGLSYTTFSLKCVMLHHGLLQGNVNAKCTVTNTGILLVAGWTMANCIALEKNKCNSIRLSGDVVGDEVVLVYHSAGADIRTKVDHPVTTVITCTPHISYIR